MMYKSDISDTKWWLYDIPGNLGWIIYFTAFGKMVRNQHYESAAICSAPAALMATGIAELISERVEGLDRELPRKRLRRGFGALTLGGITGIAAAALSKEDGKSKVVMGGGAALCAVFAGLLLKEYKREGDTSDDLHEADESSDETLL